jgi:hypothetical protein
MPRQPRWCRTWNKPVGTGHFDRHHLHHWAWVQVWASPLSDGGSVVLLFNRGDAPTTITAKWATLGLAEGAYEVGDQ